MSQAAPYPSHPANPPSPVARQHDPASTVPERANSARELPADDNFNRTMSPRALVERIPAGALLVHKNRIFFNRYVEQIVGYRVDELPTLDVWFSKLYGGNADEVRKLYEGDRDAGFPHATTVPLLHKNGSTRYVEFAAHSDDGDEIWLLHDVTDQQRAEQENRETRALLEAIRRAQSQFIAEVDPRDVFSSLLNELLQLTGSGYGFIGEIMRPAGQPPYIKTLACTDIAWDAASREFYEKYKGPGLEFRNLDTLFGACLKTGEPVIANQASQDPRAGGIPAGHPALHSFLGLPCYHGDTAVCMVGIANRVGGYDDALVKYLQPFLSTCANLMEASRLVQSRAEARTALRESETRFRLAAEAVNGLIYDFDSRRGRVYRSRGLYEIIGLYPDDLPPTVNAWTSLIHPDDLPSAEAKMHSISVHGGKFDVEYRVRHQAGHYVHVWDKGIVVHESGTGNVRVVGCTIDLTAQKRAGEILRRLTDERTELLERLQMMLDRMPVGCILCDDHFRFTYWNAAAEKIFGFAFEEVRGRHPFGLIVPPARQPFVAELFRQIAEGKPVGETVGEAQTKGGRPIVCEWSNAPLTDADGKFTGLLSMCQDVTQRQLNEHKLRQQDADLTHIARLSTLGEMVAGIAHEITQPLHAIGSYAGACNALLEDDQLVSVGTLREWTTKIGELAGRSGEIIWRLRNFSRKAESNRNPFDLNELVRESAELIAFEARRGNVQLDFELGEVSKPNADRIQIQQVLVNLLRNAYDAVTQPRSDEAAICSAATIRRVILRTSIEADMLQISVNDNGPGLDPSMAGKLFQAFNTTKPEGMGVGLAISRTIVEAHGGKIWAEPNAGAGVTFRFTLPCHEMSPAN